MNLNSTYFTNVSFFMKSTNIINLLCEILIITVFVNFSVWYNLGINNETKLKVNNDMCPQKILCMSVLDRVILMTHMT